VQLQFLEQFHLGGRIIEAGIIVIAAFILWAVVRAVVARMVKRARDGHAMFRKPHFRWAEPMLRSLDHERRVQRAETIGALLSSLAALTIFAVAIMMALQSLGVDIAPILASVGIAGIAVGFGAREIIRDAFMGFFITIEDQYGIGDTVEVGDVLGVVQSVGLRITRLVDANGAVWYIRNGDIAKVRNRSQGTYVEAAPNE
jgi:small-conductance mechanosensitive channel